MPGSAANPVRLWPYSRIVEVGWPAHWYAFPISIRDSDYEGHDTPCSPTIGSDNGNFNLYMTQTTMGISTGAVFRFVGDAWDGPVSGALFEGEPTDPFVDTFSDGVAAASYDEPHRLALADGSGVADAPPPPGNPSEVFTAGDVSYEVIGRPLDSGAAECRLAGVPATGVLQYPPAGDYGAVTSAASLGLDAIVLTHNGRQYTPVGAYLIPGTKGGALNEISAPVQAWILCQASASTA
jgi:hypothetical protein